jgi:hypothetical protein
VVVGLPVVVTVNVNADPAVAVALAALVNAGTGTFVLSVLTVSVITWLTVPPALAAVIVTE